jgi:polyhydroxyalkanoate synthase
MVFAGADDAIAPTGSVKALLPLLTSSREARFEIVPGGHLGLLTGREARTGTWPLVDEWMDEWAGSVHDRVGPGTAPNAAATRRTPSKGARTSSATTPSKPASKTASKTASKAATTRTAKSPASPTPDAPAIGANPDRRYGSAGSRALRR